MSNSPTLSSPAPDDMDETDETDELLDGQGSGFTGVPRLSGLAIAVLGAVGLLAAFTLTVERIAMLKNPDHGLSCDFSPILSCGSVMSTDQAAAFGVPNSLLGVVAFTVVVVLGVLLAARVELPRWVLDGLAVGSLLGLASVGWLISQSMFVIGVLCPWCMVVWSVTIPLFIWCTTLALRAHFPDSDAVELVWDARYLILVALYLVVIVLALVQFWDYWSTLL